DHTKHLRRLAHPGGALDVHSAAGLSTNEIYLSFDKAAREALARKLDFLDDIGCEYLAVLFDDMRGDIPDLAARQIEIVNWIRDRTSAQRLIFCPTYYSDDPILDRIFGARPEG